MSIPIPLIIEIGGTAITIARDIGPHLKEFGEFLKNRGIEADRVRLDEIIIDAEARRARSEREVQAGSKPPADDEGPSA